MQDNIKEILRLNLEIEGILRIIDARPSEFAMEILAEVTNDLSAKVDKLIKSNKATATPTKDNEVDNRVLIISEEEETIDLGEPAAEEEEDLVPDSEPSALDEVTEASQEECRDTVEDEATDEETEVEIEAEPEIEATEETEVEVGGSEIEAAEETEAMDSISPTIRTLADEIKRHAVPTLSDKLAAAETLTFNINDSRRFIRGIFGDDDKEFDEVVDKLRKCESLSDVWDYLFNELGWDLENTEVNEFYTIVAKHFNNK